MGRGDGWGEGTDGGVNRGETTPLAKGLGTEDLAWTPSPSPTAATLILVHKERPHSVLEGDTVDGVGEEVGRAERAGGRNQADPLAAGGKNVDLME